MTARAPRGHADTAITFTATAMWRRHAQCRRHMAGTPSTGPNVCEPRRTSRPQSYLETHSPGATQSFQSLKLAPQSILVSVFAPFQINRKRCGLDVPCGEARSERALQDCKVTGHRRARVTVCVHILSTVVRFPLVIAILLACNLDQILCVMTVRICQAARPMVEETLVLGLGGGLQEAFAQQSPSVRQMCRIHSAWFYYYSGL
jgi:hypothetical protein